MCSWATASFLSYGHNGYSLEEVSETKLPSAPSLSFCNPKTHNGVQQNLPDKQQQVKKQNVCLW